MHKSFSILAVAAAAALLSAAPVSAAVFVKAERTTPTALANVTAGQFYTVTATGTANIYVAGDLEFDADGRPTHKIDGVYADFNTDGCCYSDPSNKSVYGPAGSNGLLGSLVGTYSSAPTSSSAYFQLGQSVHFKALSTGTLYGLVNDANGAYSDNGEGTGFSVTVTADAGGASVPEPASWALMIVGFAGMGATLRRRRHAALSA
jgi:hypothetical protein